MMARADTTGDAPINVTGAPSGAPIIEFVGVTKRFPGVVANDGVDLAIRPGEVHVLLGENGAGKSTLIGMLSGLQQPDEGAIRVDGRPQRISSPRRALNLGIGTVFQHVMLAPSLSVLDNVALGGPWWRRPDRAGLARRLRDMNASIGVSIDPDAVTGNLSLGEQQQAEIVRALLRGSRVLVLDEATAMLTPKGVEELGALMRRLAERGLAIVFITHKLKEAFAFGDRISILRLGRKVGEIGPERLAATGKDALTAEVVRLMFGSNAPMIAAAEHAPPPPLRATERRVLEVRDLAVDDPAVNVVGICLDVAEGEILGVAGIDGNGQKQLAEAVAGQRTAAAGQILLDGVRTATPWCRRTPTSRLAVRHRRPPCGRHGGELLGGDQLAAQANRRGAVLVARHRATPGHCGARADAGGQVRRQDTERRDADRQIIGGQHSEGHIGARAFGPGESGDLREAHLRARRAEHRGDAAAHQGSGADWHRDDPDFHRSRGIARVVGSDRRHVARAAGWHIGERPGCAPTRRRAYDRSFIMTADTLETPRRGASRARRGEWASCVRWR